MTFLRSILPIGLILALACSKVSAQTPDNKDFRNQSVEPQQEVVVEPRAEDVEIASRLEKILSATGWFSSPRVSVREGVVFLDGAAASDEQREWAGNLARKTQDVVAVVNRIVVEPVFDWGFEPAYYVVKALVQKAVTVLPLTILGASILLLTGWIAYLTASVARRLLKPRIRSPLLLTVVARAIAVPLFLLGLYLVLQVAGLTRLAITVLGGTGVLGIVLGFAFRDIAENFLASLLLSIRNPFLTGDLIRIGDHEGIVQNLNTRTTVLLTLEGNQIQVPNATVYKSTLINYTRNPTRRADFIVPIATGAPVTKAQSIVLDVLRKEGAICSPPEPLVLVDKLEADRIELKVYFWFDSSNVSPIKLRSALLRRARRALLDAGIQMPAPLPLAVLQPAPPKTSPAKTPTPISPVVESVAPETPQVSALAPAPANAADAVNLLEDAGTAATASRRGTRVRHDRSTRT
ncbi:MAG: mechanosensitive ion channel [Hyphomicrobium sp.]|nr:mechanosensitive ion channel [Hyphomicrobium sp.]